MPKYIEYDASGNILRYGVCSRLSFDSAEQAGKLIAEPEILKDGIDVTHKVELVNGKAVKVGNKVKCKEVKS